MFILSLYGEYTYDHFLDHRFQMFARMWNKGIFHALTAHVYVGTAISESNLAIAKKVEKHIPCASSPALLENFSSLHKDSCTRIILQRCMKLCKIGNTLNVCQPEAE